LNRSRKVTIYLNESILEKYCFGYTSDEFKKADKMAEDRNGRRNSALLMNQVGKREPLR
jgi:hypothetical protein